MAIYFCVIFLSTNIAHLLNSKFNLFVLPQKMPQIVWIPEMENWPIDNISISPISNDRKHINILNSAPVSAFFQKWKQLTKSLETLITSEKIVQISRWAINETMQTNLKPGWLANISFSQVGFSEQTKLWTFYQNISEGFPLPSHSPIVFRRLLFAAVFSEATNNIEEVFITIRGWREE